MIFKLEKSISLFILVVNRKILYFWVTSQENHSQNNILFWVASIILKICEKNIFYGLSTLPYNLFKFLKKYEKWILIKLLWCNFISIGVSISDFFDIFVVFLSLICSYRFFIYFIDSITFLYQFYRIPSQFHFLSHLQSFYYTKMEKIKITKIPTYSTTLWCFFCLSLTKMNRVINRYLSRYNKTKYQSWSIDEPLTKRFFRNGLPDVWSKLADRRSRICAANSSISQFLLEFSYSPSSSSVSSGSDVSPAFDSVSKHIYNVIYIFKFVIINTNLYLFFRTKIFQAPRWAPNYCKIICFRKYQPIFDNVLDLSIKWNLNTSYNRT